MRCLRFALTMQTRPLSPGQARGVLEPETTALRPCTVEPHHLVTHGVILGMTGSGKTGLGVVVIEEALRSKVPVLMIDVKGDLPNLLLSFPALDGPSFAPWVDADAAQREGLTVEASAEAVATRWREGLARSGLGPDDVRAFRESVAFRLITPGTAAGEPLHVLSALEEPSDLWEIDEEAARESLSASLSLLLRMLDRATDGAPSREHVLLSLFAERRLRAGQRASLEDLVGDLQRPPLARVGALSVDEFLPEDKRARLAQDLNTLIASPTFSTWRQGARLDVAAWLRPRPDGKTPAVIVSVAHLDDADRALVLSLLLEQVLAYVRAQPGTSMLRALVFFDEVYGFLPPHPASPPTKRPIMALLKQARAFGVGLILATQNPMDLDYKALSNAGIWFVGRLQTDADRARVVDGLTGSSGADAQVDPSALGDLLKSLPGRQFYLRNVHDASGSKLLSTRFTLSWLRGPMTRAELRKLSRTLAPPPPAAPVAPVAPAAPVAPVAAPTPAEAVGVVATPRALPQTLASPASVAAPSPAPLAPTRVSASPLAAPAEAPAPPPNWRVVYSSEGGTLKPWVGAGIVAHLRDARLGVQLTRALSAMAPLGDDGRPVTAQGRLFDPQRFGPSPGPYSAFAPLPEALFRKGGVAAVERVLRDEVYRTIQVALYTHKGLAMVSGDGESLADFQRRVVLEAQRRAVNAVAAEQVKHGPRLQRASDDVAAARAALDALAREAPAGGAVASVSALIRGGQRALQRLETQQDRQAARRLKLEGTLVDAENALRAAIATRDAAVATLEREALAEGQQVETRTLAAKRDDIEVQSLTLVWAP